MNLILKRDSDLQTVAEMRERIQSIRFQRESEINRATRSYSVHAWERKNERIRQFTKRENALLLRLKEIRDIEQNQKQA